MHQFHNALLALTTLLSLSPTSFQAFGQVTSILETSEDRAEATVTTKDLSSSKPRFLADGQTVTILGGPFPHGWTAESDVDDE